MTARVLRIAVIVAALALMPAAPAVALPSDPPVQALLPADGATLPTNPSGIELRYSCGLYISSGEPPFAVYGSRRDYGTVVATSPALGNDGRLLQSNWIDLPPGDDLPDNDIPADTCRTFFAEDGYELRPGVYYWQAYRICIGCGGWEASPVRSFRLTASGSGTRLTIAPPARAYGGIPFHVQVGGRALPTGTGVEVQARRRPQGAWKAVAGFAVLTDSRTQATSAGGPVTLATGRYQVRSAVRIGAETVTSAARPLAVAAPADWPRGVAGRWKQPKGLKVAFRVSADGRTLSGGSFGVPLLCPQVPLPGGQGQLLQVLAQAEVPRAKLAPDGSFAWAGSIKRNNIYVYGRVRGGSASGRVRLGIGTCTGGASWKAVKAR